MNKLLRPVFAALTVIVGLGCSGGDEQGFTAAEVQRAFAREHVELREVDFLGSPDAFTIFYTADRLGPDDLQIYVFDDDSGAEEYEDKFDSLRNDYRAPSAL